MALLGRAPFDDLETLINEQKRFPHESTPVNVTSVCHFLSKHSVGFLLSRNSEARSCREARDKRNRLGHVGIPLFDELKSLVGEVVTESGNTELLAVHCRANYEINDEKLCSLLGVEGTFVKLDATVLM